VPRWFERDVVVVGAGNAALCSALAAAEGEAPVRVLEFAPIDARGGNSAFTGGAMRVPFRNMADLLELMPDLSQEDQIVPNSAPTLKNSFSRTWLE